MEKIIKIINDSNVYPIEEKEFDIIIQSSIRFFSSNASKEEKMKRLTNIKKYLNEKIRPLVIEKNNTNIITSNIMEAVIYISYSMELIEKNTRVYETNEITKSCLIEINEELNNILKLTGHEPIIEQELPNEKPVILVKQA